MQAWLAHLRFGLLARVIRPREFAREKVTTNEHTPTDHREA